MRLRVTRRFGTRRLDNHRCESQGSTMELVLRLLHIVPAIIAAGGVFFMWIALAPSLNSIEDESRAKLMESIRTRWSKVVAACSGLLLASGLYNAIAIILAYEFVGFPGKLYHGMVLLKLLLALGVFFISSVLAGRSDMAKRFR